MGYNFSALHITALSYGAVLTVYIKGDLSESNYFNSKTAKVLGAMGASRMWRLLPYPWVRCL